MKTKIWYWLFTIAVLTAKAQFPYVVPNVDWIHYYSDADALANTPTALDANSNVYLTGYSGVAVSCSLVALKYDSTGVLVYTYTYFQTAHNSGQAIKIDGSGNALIAGITTAVSTGRDYFIAKVSPSGVQQWVTTFDAGFGNGDDEATDLAVLSNGDLIVTGRSKNSNGDLDIVTLKLDGSSGGIIWQHTYNGNSSHDDEGIKIVISSDDNTAYVAGNTTDATNGTDIVLYAIDVNTGSNFFSAVKFDGTSNSNDKVKGLILCGGNITLCGELNNSGSGLDATTIKLDGSTGAVIFKQDYDAYSGATNRATALVRDSAGNIGVTGIAINGATYEYHTVLYDSTGTQYGLNTESTGLSFSSVDPKICNDTIAHHWYVSGEGIQVTKDVFVYQITPSGNTSWRQYIDGQNNDIDCATGVAVNGVGVVYVGALSKNSSADYDLTAIKLNQTPVYWPPDFNNDQVNLNHLYLRNEGQIMRTDSTLGNEALYYTHNTNPSIFIEQDGFNFIFNKVDTVQNILDTIERIKYKFLYNNPLANLHEYLPRSTTYHYYLGYALSPEIENVRGNERIFIPNYYPYIDLHYFSGADGIKYYLVVRPGASLAEVRMEIQGASSVSTSTATGSLFIDGYLGDVELRRPIAYTVNMLGQVVTVSGTASWVHLYGDVYRIQPPSGYNSAWPLIIQVSPNPPSPMSAAKVSGTNLEYSTYYGGVANDVFTDVRALPNGNRYITGYTNAGTFPPVNSLNTYNGNYDAVIMKYTGDDTLRYATFQGGSSIDQAFSIATDSQENVFIGGNTSSVDMLGKNVSGATNQFNNGGASGNFKQDGFLCKLSQSPAGTLVWRRYFGGSLSDAINNIYIDGSDNLYIAGSSNSIDCPVVNAFKSTLAAPTTANPANIDAIFGKINSSLVAQWITFYGGSANAGGNGSFTQDEGNDIVVDNSGRVIGCGFTDATNLSTINSTGQTSTFFKSTISGQQDGFLVRYSSSGVPDFSSYFGGSNIDEITRLVYKANFDELYFAGTSLKGTGFPFKNKNGAHFSQYSLGGKTAFVGMLFGDLNEQWCTYWGHGQTSTKQTRVEGLSVDDDGLVYLSGFTQSDTLTFPTTPPTTIVYKDSIRNSDDGFVAIFDNNKHLYHAHYFGGTAGEKIHNSDIAFGQKLYVVGEVSSSNFPVAYTSVNATEVDTIFDGGGNDGFIARFDLENYQVTGIKQVDFDKSLLTLYPNPTSSKFNIEFEGILDSKPFIKVYNLMGQLIFEQRIENAVTTIDCGTWVNGVYLINVSNKQTQATFKLIKQ